MGYEAYLFDMDGSLNLRHYFDTIISNEDVKQQKPNPEAYLLAKKQLNVVQRPTLVFEDSYTGIMAAHRAECQVIGIRHYFNQSHGMSKAQLVINNYQELIEMWKHETL